MVLTRDLNTPNLTFFYSKYRVSQKNGIRDFQIINGYKSTF